MMLATQGNLPFHTALESRPQIDVDPVLEERDACAAIVEAGARRWLELGGKKPAPFRQSVSEALMHVAKKIRTRTQDD